MPENNRFPDDTGHQVQELKVRQIELEMQYSRLFESMTDAYACIDMQGYITDSNANFQTMTGYSKEELLSLNYRQLTPDKWHAKEKEIIENQVIPNGTSQLFEKEYLRKDGTIISVELKIFLLKNAADEPIGMWAIIRDISERKRSEAALMQAYNKLETRVAERTAELVKANERTRKMSFELVWAEERERERIAGELHDQVGQSLLLAKMKLDELADRLPTDAHRTVVEETTALLNRSIHDIRSLTFKMRPPILESAGLDSSLEWLCKSMQNDYALQIDFNHDEQPRRLSSEVRYALYQAVRELLINVVKHSGAGKAQLSIKTVGDFIVLQVQDNGVGFNYKNVCLNQDGISRFGLFNVQQRMEHMGGGLTVESTHTSGTTVTLMVMKSDKLRREPGEGE